MSEKNSHMHISRWSERTRRWPRFLPEDGIGWGYGCVGATVCIIQMQGLIDYNFLIIGRSGSGKSATSKLLTGDPSIAVANSINEITRQVKFYQGISHSFGEENIRFGILDIPGLDRIENRFAIRERILQELEKLKISLHGVIYVASLTERDTIDQTKLFHFVEQLPWASQVKKACLIPILTKYDNFIIDSPDQDIDRTKDQFHKMFERSGFGQAWGKRVYWVNFTKSLEFKMKINQDIREKHENQIQRLISMTRKHRKALLTAQAIRQYINKENTFVLEGFLKKIRREEIAYALIPKKHKIPLHIKIEPTRLQESLTAVSVSSIGMFLSRALKRDIPAPLSMIMIGIPMTLTFINLVRPHRDSPEKLNYQELEESRHKILQCYSGVCESINIEIQHEWQELNKNIRFVSEGNKLKCLFDPSIHYNFFSLEGFYIRDETSEKPEIFEKVYTGNDNLKCFQIGLPVLEDNLRHWNPTMEMQYHVKAFDQNAVMRTIETLRQQFNGLNQNLFKQ